MKSKRIQGKDSLPFRDQRDHIERLLTRSGFHPKPQYWVKNHNDEPCKVYFGNGIMVSFLDDHYDREEKILPFSYYALLGFLVDENIIDPPDPKSRKEKKPQLYLRLFHGRKDPNDEMAEGWGTEGPTFKLSGVTWTYGEADLWLSIGSDNIPITLSVDMSPKADIALFCNEEGQEDLIKYDGIYYGDFEIFTTSDPIKASLLDRNKLVSNRR